MFLVANGPVQLSYSSTGVHPEQRSRQSSLSVPREVKDLLLVLTLLYSCRHKNKSDLQVGFDFLFLCKTILVFLYTLYLLILVFLRKYLNFITSVDWVV